MRFLKNIFGKENNTNQNLNNSYSQVEQNEETKLSSLNLNKEESIKELNLRKDMISSLCLEKKEFGELTARVALVLDYSGSMQDMYKDGTVQKIIDRLLPIAMEFDDNGEMEAWLFENSFKRIKDISLDNYYNYLKNEKILNRYDMGGTQYSPVIKDIVKKYTVEDTANIPTLVLFITDGDNFNSDKIKTTKALREASNYPIFWQFVGIGNGNFNYLEELDEMEGRHVDNANFFSVVDLDNISDKELYKRLLNEYPDWITKIRNMKMI